jgi:2-polyprenyl-6-methoxyphenol hydroxylase-like FAD-dependent oxidoreductase
MAEHFDLIVVGGGIGGAALATVMSRAGSSVLVLEKSTVYRDHVRGEWMAPWGVAELERLGLYESVRAGGGHHLARHWSCHEEVPADESVAMAIDLTTLVPGVRGPLCIGHPALCELLVHLAAESGAKVARGVSDVRVAPGRSPAVTYRLDGAERRATTRLVVGADGRGSQVRRQAGIELHRDPTHHLFAGMLVEAAHGWPDDTQAIGAEGDVHFLAFPQGNGRVRLYLGYSSDQPRRLAGADGPRAFLAAFRLACLPGSEHLAGARPAGPCSSFPNADSWTDVPARDGVVLIGDAAGSNDPIIGQGLSITLRDVRLVRDALLGERDWTTGIFAAYAAERAERMRRLRFSASVIATMENEFGDEARARRSRARERQLQDPTLLFPLAAAFLGPENVPAETFEEATRQRLLG